jgi:two-component sensor histidine kinase
VIRAVTKPRSPYVWNSACVELCLHQSAYRPLSGDAHALSRERKRMVTVVSFHSKTSEFVVEQTPDAQAQPDLTGDALRLRVRQQEILAELGVLALQGIPFRRLLDQTARFTAEGLQAEFAKILEYLPFENRFLVTAGVGWEPGVIGIATIGADEASPAGFALRTGKAVISNHLENEERFRTPQLLVEHGIRRAMNVVLQGDNSPFGVLEVDSRLEGEFSENDITFLQGAANVLGMAIHRQRIEQSLLDALDRQQLLVKEVDHRINNSLQLVITMLHLQAAGTASADVRHELREASSRIAAIARAHQRLYGSAQIEMLDLGAYLSDICHDLCEAVPDCEVFVSAVEGIQIATDTAIPIALIVNELMLNSAKYAYPGRSCQAWLTLTRPQEDTIIVSVRDEGVGLPPDFDITSGKRLGMRIVTALSQQIKADLQVQRRTPGAEFLLAIPVQQRG